MSDSFLPPVMVEFGGNATQGLAALTKMVTGLERLTKASTAAADAVTKAFAAMERGAAVLESVAAAADVAKKSMQGLSRASNAVAKATEKAATAANAGMASISAAAERMGASVEAASASTVTGLAAVTAESRKAAVGVRAATVESAATGTAAVGAESKIKKLGASFLGLGTVLNKLKTLGPLSLGAIAIASVDLGMKFDSSITTLLTQAGVAQSKLAGLKSGVLSLAGQVGFSPTSLSQALFHVESGFESMGITSANALNMTKIAAEGAAVGHSDLIKTTTALTAVMASGYVPITDASKAMGVLNAMVGSGEMTMDDLTKAFSGGALAVVKGFGATIKDAGAALATFGDNNIRGAAAGTMFRMTIQALASPVATAKKYLTEFGMTHDTLAKDMQKGGMKLALQDLEAHFKSAGISATEQGKVITDMFGKKAGAGIAVLLGQYDRLMGKYPAMDAGVNKFGDAWKATQATFSQQMSQIKNGVDSLLIRLGEKLIPQVSSLISLLETKGAPVVHAFASALSQIGSGFSGGPKPAAAAPAKPSAASLLVPIGASAVPSMLAPPVAKAPDLTPWQQVGKVFAGVAGDLAKFAGQVGTAFSNLLAASEPALVMLGGMGLGTLRAIGAVLSGVVGPVLVSVTGFLKEHTQIIQGVVAGYLAYRGALLAMSLATKTVAIVTKALAVEQAILNAVMDANPIMLIVGAIALLAFGFYELWTRCQTFRVIVTEVFAAVSNIILGFAQGALQMFKFVIDGWMSFAGMMIHGAAIAFGWVPGIGDDLKMADKSFGAFKAGVNGALDSAINKVGQWKDNVNNMPKEIKLQGNIDDLNKKLDDAKAQLKTVPASQKVAVQANIDSLTQQIATAQAQINALHGKTVTVTYQAVNHQAVSTTGFTYANGGIRYAADGLMNQAMMARAGSNILWAEQSTGGESFIPHARSKRPRSREIAAKTVGILGGQVQWDGGAGTGAAGAMASYSTLGAAIPAGVANGVASAAGAAHAAVLALARGTVDVFSQELGIQSPSKKFRSLGAYVIYGLVQGLTGTTAAVKAATKHISDQLYVDFGGAHPYLQAAVARDNKALLSLAARRDAVAVKLKAANKNLASLQADWAKEQKSVADSIMQSSTVVMAAPTDGSTLTSFQVIAQMQDRMQKTLQFAANLQMAQKNGLSAALVQQIAAAGVDQGGATAQALASATKGQIQQLNQLQGNMQTAANSVGGAVADSMYGAGIQAAQGLIKGLAAQQKAIEAQMLKIALSMQAAIKKALGIKSPSTVFADLGQYIPQGLAKGIQSGTHHATGAVMSMSGAVASAGGGRNLAYARGGGSGGGGTTVIYNINVQVDGSVTSDAKLADRLQELMLRKGGRNSQTYQAYKR